MCTPKLKKDVINQWQSAATTNIIPVAQAEIHKRMLTSGYPKLTGKAHDFTDRVSALKPYWDTTDIYLGFQMPAQF